MKMIKYIYFLFWGLVISSLFFWFIHRQNSKVNLESKTSTSITDTKCELSETTINVLNLKGNHSIIITIYPCVMEEKSYLIELFNNGTIETSVGMVNRKAFIGEFTGKKEDIFKETINTKKRVLTEDETEQINQMINKIDWEGNYKKYKRKEVGDDANQKMIWIGDKAYYFFGTFPSTNEFTELIEQIAKCSPIEVKVRDFGFYYD